MKAAFYKRQGPAHEVLQIGEVSTPVAGPGEVRVRVYVSGLNPTDVKARTGFSAPMTFEQVIPHQDGAGVIDAVGHGVPSSRVGERVWIYEAQHKRPYGTAAEFVVVPSPQAVRLPDEVSFDIGATLGIPVLTAYRCLFSDGDISGRRVLVHGGAGAVGNAAILLAKWAGAWVATTISSREQAEIAHSAGADLIINRREENVLDRITSVAGGAGIHLIVDVDLMENLNVNMACISPGGVISSYATSTPTDTLSLPILKAMVHGCVFRFVFIYSVPAEAKAVAVEAVNRCLSEGGYRPTIGLRVDLNQIATAHEAIESRKILGRILVMVVESAAYEAA